MSGRDTFKLKFGAQLHLDRQLILVLCSNDSILLPESFLPGFLKKKKKVLIQILCANDIISLFLSFLDCKMGGG